MKILIVLAVSLLLAPCCQTSNRATLGVAPVRGSLSGYDRNDTRINIKKSTHINIFILNDSITIDTIN